MALGATIYKVSLTVSDMDRHIYDDFDLTLAKHPSETEERMMLRLAAFALNADKRLAFTRGIVQEDEPDLWRTSYGGDIELWIELGQPDEKRLRKACGRAGKVLVYTYNRKAAEAWWRQNASRFSRFSNLSILHLQTEGSIGNLLQRSMHLQALIQDGTLTLGDEAGNTLTITQEKQDG